MKTKKLNLLVEERKAKCEINHIEIDCNNGLAKCYGKARDFQRANSNGLLGNKTNKDFSYFKSRSEGIYEVIDDSLRMICKNEGVDYLG